MRGILSPAWPAAGGALAMLSLAAFLSFIEKVGPDLNIQSGFLFNGFLPQRMRGHQVPAIRHYKAYSRLIMLIGHCSNEGTENVSPLFPGGVPTFSGGMSPLFPGGVPTFSGGAGRAAGFLGFAMTMA